MTLQTKSSHYHLYYNVPVLKTVQECDVVTVIIYTERLHHQNDNTHIDTRADIDRQTDRHTE